MMVWTNIMIGPWVSCRTGGDSRDDDREAMPNIMKKPGPTTGDASWPRQEMVVIRQRIVTTISNTSTVWTNHVVHAADFRARFPISWQTWRQWCTDDKSWESVISKVRVDQCSLAIYLKYWCLSSELFLYVFIFWKRKSYFREPWNTCILLNLWTRAYKK